VPGCLGDAGAVTSFKRELERRFGTRIALRIGVNTGEVVVGDPSNPRGVRQRRWVNVAAGWSRRLGSGEVLLGESTYRLVRDAVHARWWNPWCEGKVGAPYRFTGCLQVKTVGPPPRQRTDAACRPRGVSWRYFEREFVAVLTAEGADLSPSSESRAVGKSRLASELVEQIGAGHELFEAPCLFIRGRESPTGQSRRSRRARGIRDEHSASMLGN